jgi:nucleoside-diphosphate-sugar epimerase
MQMSDTFRAPPLVLVTGSSGFVGSALTARLKADPRFRVRGASRRDGMAEAAGPELGPEADWSLAVNGADLVVHLAARVHMMRDDAADPLAEFRRVNALGTERLARQSAKAGVRRLVYLSSVKVNGEETAYDESFSERSAPNPVDPYGISKYEAELALARVAEETGMEVVIIRPPLIHGPGVRANFLSMMRWLQAGVPLPFGAIHNRRSLVGLDNLVDLIVTTLTHSAAANQTFLAGDGEDVSTTELLERLGRALGRPARLIPVPMSLLKVGFGMIGKGDLGRRLCGSLRVDVTKARQTLGWTPPHSVDEGLRRTAAGFLGRRQ